MEESGLVICKVYVEVFLRVDYILIEVGYSLKFVFDLMIEWGIFYKNKV